MSPKIQLGAPNLVAFDDDDDEDSQDFGPWAPAIEVKPRRSDMDALPSLVRLDEFLATPDEEVRYRIGGLLPIGGRAILAAPMKAGKTTFVANLIRALGDGEPFLDAFEVQPASKVVLIDDELDERTLRVWLREQGIRHPERVFVVSLRGRAGSFNLLDPGVRAQWAEQIGPADVLIFDCLRPVLDALRLSEDKDAGRFLVAFDALYAAGISESVVVHHMGHANERSRGDSRLRDWPDAEWMLIRGGRRDDEDLRAPRYFQAYGRDVDVPQGQLTFDPASRRLTLTGGTRLDHVIEDLIPLVVGAVEAQPGLSSNALEKAVPAKAEHVRLARDAAERRGLIAVQRAPRLISHYPVEGSSVRPTSSKTSPASSSVRPIGTRTVTSNDGRLVRPRGKPAA